MGMSARSDGRGVDTVMAETPLIHGHAVLPARVVFVVLKRKDDPNSI
jgi:hypothetical protein